MRHVALTAEFTGLRPKRDQRVVELALVELVDMQLTGRHLHFFFNPERQVTREAKLIHGLTDEFLADKPTFPVVADDVISFLWHAHVVVHCASLDAHFLDRELIREDRPSLRSLCDELTDVYLVAKDQYPAASNSLEALRWRYDISVTNRRESGALLDCMVLAQVFVRMSKLAGNVGQCETGCCPI